VCHTVWSSAPAAAFWCMCVRAEDPRMLFVMCRRQRQFLTHTGNQILTTLGLDTTTLPVST